MTAREEQPRCTGNVRPVGRPGRGASASRAVGECDLDFFAKKSQ
jgi:hypothetical protein